VVQQPTCKITATVVDPRPARIDEPIHIEAAVTVEGQAVNNAQVTAHIKRPDNHTDPIPLPWQQAILKYNDSYTKTDTPGRYEISATAADGPDFRGCSTLPPPEEVELPPGPTLSIQPAHLEMPVCSLGGETDIILSQAENVQRFSFTLHFSKEVVAVADQDWNQAGVQIRLSNDIRRHNHMVITNDVDQSAGEVKLAINLLGSATLDGDVTLGTVSWLPQAVDETELIFKAVALLDLNGQPVPVTSNAGNIKVIPGCGTVGRCYLQGRQDHRGVDISAGEHVQAQTGADGSFFIAGTDLITARFPGYLSAQASVGTLVAQSSSPTNLGTITLLAGDVNGDDRIDIFDLAYIAARYQSADSVADFNKDGWVDVYDLALAANNYHQHGPLTQWQPD
jgi:hypothetical protein